MQTRAIIFAAGCLMISTGLASAQIPYQAPYQNWSQVQAMPPSWSYDPYTSGMGTCVQSNRGNSPPCRELIDPTYGQPNYWPYH
jgi:hypothetical protein